MDARGGLSAFAALRALDPAHLDALAAAFVERTYRDGDVIVRSGTRPAQAYLVLDGELSVRAGADGERELARCGPGALVGHVELFDGDPAATTVRVVGRARLGTLGAAAFGMLTGARAELAYAFQRALGEQVAADFRRQLGVRARPRLV